MSESVQQRLAEPFDPSEIGWKPQRVSGNRAMAAAYISARVVQDRLDEVMGVENWMDDYEILSDGSVVCRLRLKINGEWVTKSDVGSQSEQPDGGDRLKAAFSDALKRSAVKFGIGRVLYRLKQQWCDYDPQKKQFVNTPQLPAWALPKNHKAQPAPQQQQQRPAQQPAPQQQAPPPPAQRPPQQQQANPDGNPEFYKTTLVAVRDCRSPNELTAVKNLAKAKWGTLNQPQKDGLAAAVKAKDDQFQEQAAQTGQPADAGTYPDDIPY